MKVELARCMDMEMIRAGLFKRAKWYQVYRKKEIMGNNMIMFKHLAGWFNKADFDVKMVNTKANMEGQE